MRPVYKWIFIFCCVFIVSIASNAAGKPGVYVQINPDNKWAASDVLKSVESYYPAIDTSSPVIAGDFADPSIIRIGSAYYAAGTSSEWAPHFPIYKSNNLTDWKLITYVFPQKKSWMSSSFWAPELYYHNGKVYAYYTVRDTNNISCIGVATAESPEKGFTDHGALIRTGKEAIDAFVFNDSGQLYISWKAYGLDKRPIELLSSKLSADGLKLEGEAFSIKKDEAGKGMEGQSIVKHNGYYYLFYSAGSCCGVPCTYNVRVSRSKSIKGPFEEFEQNPILKENESWMCTGHGTPVSVPGGRWFYIYHAYEKQFNVFTGRQALIAEIVWNDESGWPSFKTSFNNNPKVSGNNSKVSASWTDDFVSTKLLPNWSWDFRHGDPYTKNENGTMVLSGKTKAGNITGTVLCVRPIAGNYEIRTEVINLNTALKGLVLYGDYNSAAGIGIKDTDVIIWTVKNKKKEILQTVKIKTAKSVKLKMVINEGHMLNFFYSMDGKDWLSMRIPGISPDGLDGSFLKQWDRSPRPGIIHQGNESQPARFSYFTIINR